MHTCTAHLVEIFYHRSSRTKSGQTYISQSAPDLDQCCSFSSSYVHIPHIMVLTRSSYSKSGTPLASPLATDRKPMERRNSRCMKYHSADASTASFIDSPVSSQTPLSPSTPLPIPFSQELISKLSQAHLSYPGINFQLQSTPNLTQSTPTQSQFNRQSSPKLEVEVELGLELNPQSIELELELDPLSVELDLQPPPESDLQPVLDLQPKVIQDKPIQPESHREVPIQEDPTREEPIKQEEPTQAKPISGGLIQQDLLHENSIEENLNQKQLIQRELIREELGQEEVNQEELTQQAPIQNEQIQEAPAQEDLNQEELAQQAQQKELNPKALIQEAPIQYEPVQEDLIQYETMQELIQQEPIQDKPIQEDLIQDELMQKKLIQEQLIQEAPIQQEPIQKDLMQEESIQEQMVQEDMIQQVPNQETPIQEEQVIMQQQPNTNSLQDKTNQMGKKDEGGDNIVKHSFTDDVPSQSSSHTAIDPQDPQSSALEEEEILTSDDSSGRSSSGSKSSDEEEAEEEDDELEDDDDGDTALDHPFLQSDLNSKIRASDDERIKQILQKTKQEAGLLENTYNPIEGSAAEEGKMGVASCSDDASSITFGKNWIRLDDQEIGKFKNKNSILSKPIKISDIETKLFKNYLSNSISYAKLKKHEIQSSSSLPTTPDLPKIKETNFDKLLEIKQRQLGYSTSTSKPKRCNESMYWHDLPVQELTKEVKMEIQAMRLHRTLDPKSFIKGGIEKATKEPIPNKFLFGYVTGGDGSIDGSNNKSSSSLKKRSFVETLLQDDKSQEWSKKKYNEVQSSGQSGKRTKKSSFKKRH